MSTESTTSSNRDPASSERPSSDPQQQREALKESERSASAQQPENFKDRENEEKIVEVPPIDADSIPIRGLDPDR